MNSKRPLAPGFINKLDNKLLINNPSVWSTRSHLVVYYCLIFILFMVAIGFVVPSDARQDSDIYIWATIVALVSTIGLVFWMIYLLRFNVFKRFGIQDRFDGLRTFILYFIPSLFLVVLPFVPSLIQKARANIAYSDNEIIEDVNMINESICKLERDSVPLRWDRATYHLKTTNDYFSPDSSLGYNEAEGHHYYLDSSSFRSKTIEADSVIKISNTVHTIFVCPDYQFVSLWRRGYMFSQNHKDPQLLSSLQLYKRIFQNFKNPQRDVVLNEIKPVIRKYQASIDSIPLPIDNEYRANSDYLSRIRSKYDLQDVSNSANNIIERKHDWEGFYLEVYLRLIYYISISLALLIFIFRHNTTRTFFLTLLFAVLLSIFTTLMLAVSGGGQDSFFTVFLLYYLVFVFIAFGGSAGSVRKMLTGIPINMFVIGTAFLPMIIVGLYYSILQEMESNKVMPDYSKFDNQSLHLFMAEIAGFVLLIILMQPVFKKLYRRWYALPEE